MKKKGTKDEELAQNEQKTDYTTTLTIETRRIGYRRRDRARLHIATARTLSTTGKIECATWSEKEGQRGGGEQVLLSIHMRGARVAQNQYLRQICSVVSALT